MGQTVCVVHIFISFELMTHPTKSLCGTARLASENCVNKEKKISSIIQVLFQIESFSGLLTKHTMFRRGDILERNCFHSFFHG